MMAARLATDTDGAGYLHGLKVVDIAYRAPLAAHMLAQMGAEVVLIEPPGGVAARKDNPDEWTAYGAGKRSITLDLEAETDHHRFLDLIAAADILFESEDPGRMAARSLARDRLEAVNPALIHVSITPFGSTGPKAQWQESDIVLWAAGGALWPNRDDAGAPLRIGAPQAWLHAAADAAGGALIAWFARGRSHRGQHVDISVQQSVAQATLGSIVSVAVGHPNYSPFNPRSTQPVDFRKGSPAQITKWRLSDGFGDLLVMPGPAAGWNINAVFAWMDEEGALPDDLRGWNWVTLPELLKSGELDSQDVAAARAAIADFLTTKSKADVTAAALDRNIQIAPVNTVADLLDSPHHAARGFFENVCGIRLPGPFAMGAEDAFVPMTAAPALGPRDIAFQSAARADPVPVGDVAVDLAPFAGLRVLDLAWVVAGPAIGRVLADYGAEVIRVESQKRIDAARTIGPFRDGDYDPERSGCYDGNNTGKLGVTLDLTKPDALTIVRDLVGKCDVVLESFAPGQMARWGLSHEELDAIRPGIITLSTSLMGQSGPYRSIAGFGNVASALAGFGHIAGHPGKLPTGPFGPYTDFVGPRFALVALLAAIARQRETGEGCQLDIAQAEAGIQFLAPQIAACSARGEVAGPLGNRDPVMVPHGVFPCAGHDRWIAIAVRDDDEWARLARKVGPPLQPLAGCSHDERREREDAIEVALGEWTAGCDPLTLAEDLQAEGIAAHLVSASADFVVDAQLTARGHIVRLRDDQGRESVVEASRQTLSRTPAAYLRTAPEYGRDTDWVMRDLLSRSDAEIERLRKKGVFN